MKSHNLFLVSSLLLAVWLRRRLLITIEDFLIKLIFSSLWCCNDCVCIICFFFFVLGIYKWLISLCPVIMFMFIKLCLPSPPSKLTTVLCKFSNKKYRLSLWCHPLDCVTGGAPVPSSDATNHCSSSRRKVDDNMGLQSE